MLTVLVNFKSLPRRHTSRYACGIVSWLGCLRWDLPTVGDIIRWAGILGSTQRSAEQRRLSVCGFDAVSCLGTHHLAFSAMVGCSLELWAKVNPFSPELLLSDCFHHNSKRKTQDSGIYNKTTWDVSRGGIFTVDKLGSYWSLSISFPIPE